MGSIPVHFAWSCDLYQSAAVTFTVNADKESEPAAAGSGWPARRRNHFNSLSHFVQGRRQQEWRLHLLPRPARRLATTSTMKLACVGGGGESARLSCCPEPVAFGGEVDVGMFFICRRWTVSNLDSGRLDVSIKCTLQGHATTHEAEEGDGEWPKPWRIMPWGTRPREQTNKTNRNVRWTVIQVP